MRSRALERLEALRTRAVRTIVNNQKIGVLDNLRVVEAQGLKRKVDAIVVVVGRHTDGKLSGLAAHGRRGNNVFLRRRGGGRGDCLPGRRARREQRQEAPAGGGG